MTKEDRCRKAKAFHDSGANCAQSVLAAFTDLTGLSEDESMKLTTAFGGGARYGGLCGAVSGALMVLGMLYPSLPDEGGAGKARSTQMTREFERRFQEIFRHLDCRELLADPTTVGTPMTQKLGVTQHCGVSIISATELCCDFIEEMQR